MASQEKAKLKRHVMPGQVGAWVDPHIGKVMNSKLAVVNKLKNFREPFLGAAILVQRATWLEIQGADSKDDGIEYFPV